MVAPESHQPVSSKGLLIVPDGEDQNFFFLSSSAKFSVILEQNKTHTPYVGSDKQWPW